ncbi:uncharacterized protein V1510DRAFT_409496 [Dipodascopsis tothii]|uniref:uncharacterized protein n=1 Tax=Dipodascopsis tothii TaxID=44089 RepID=UPI0034CE5778
MISATTLRNSSRSTYSVIRFSHNASARFYSEGSTGSSRGEAGGDAFTKREKANEDYYVRKAEKERLVQLKEQLEKQRKLVEEAEKNLGDKK